MNAPLSGLTTRIHPPPQVSAEALAKIEQIFSALDADHSGTIEMSDFLVRVR